MLLPLAYKYPFAPPFAQLSYNQLIDLPRRLVNRDIADTPALLELRGAALKGNSISYRTHRAERDL